MEIVRPDLPGFGDSFKPLGARYHPPFFAASVIELIDALGLARAHVIGNGMALVIWGKHDGLVPLALAAHVKSMLASARPVEVDCGHVPQLERPAETHAAIAAFLRGTSPPGMVASAASPAANAERHRRPGGAT
jgi:pimeloyl-ACP methyl ester carboxylesterase